MLCLARDEDMFWENKAMGKNEACEDISVKQIGIRLVIKVTN